MSEDFEIKDKYDDDQDAGYAFQTVTRKGKPKTIGWSLISLICGFAAFITSVFGWPGIVLGVLSIVFAVISRFNLGYFDGMLIFGFVLGLHGIFIGIASIVLVARLGDGEHSNLFEYLRDLIYKIKSGPV